jgi:hypothetical protein
MRARAMLDHRKEPIDAEMQHCVINAAMPGPHPALPIAGVALAASGITGLQPARAGQFEGMEHGDFGHENHSRLLRLRSKPRRSPAARSRPIMRSTNA